MQKRYLITRDNGGKYYPMVEGASYRYQTSDNQDYLLGFFTAQRSNAVGYMGNGTIDFGIGRNTENDDHKGLSKGTSDNDI